MTGRGREPGQNNRMFRDGFRFIRLDRFTTFCSGGGNFCWNSTPTCVHLTPNIPQTAPYIPDFSQLVLNLGSRLRE